MQRRIDLAIVVAIAAVANILYYVHSSGDFFFPDSFTYLTPAKMLLAGHGFANKPGLPETLRTPIYPLLLAAFRLNANAVLALQHLLNVAIAAAIYLFCRRRIGSRFIALLAAIVFAIDVPTVHYANKLLTETTFTALLFVVFLLALDMRLPIVNGLLCGILVLLRPVAIIYFAPLALFFALTQRPLRPIIAFCLAAIALPFAWSVRNRVESGVFTVSSIAGSNMLIYRAAGTLALLTDNVFDDELRDQQNELRDKADDEIQRVMHVPDAQELPSAVRTSRYGAYARRIILRHPIAFALLTVRGTLVNLFDSDWEAAMMVSSIESQTVRLTIDAINTAVIFFAVAGIVALWRRDRALAMLILITAAYFILISAGGESEARFRVPVVPQLAIAAACGVDAIRRGVAPAPR